MIQNVSILVTEVRLTEYATCNFKYLNLATGKVFYLQPMDTPNAKYANFIRPRMVELKAKTPIAFEYTDDVLNNRQIAIGVTPENKIMMSDYTGKIYYITITEFEELVKTEEVLFIPSWSERTLEIAGYELTYYELLPQDKLNKMLKYYKDFILKMQTLNMPNQIADIEKLYKYLKPEWEEITSQYECYYLYKEIAKLLADTDYLGVMMTSGEIMGSYEGNYTANLPAITCDPYYQNHRIDCSQATIAVYNRGTQSNLGGDLSAGCCHICKIINKHIMSLGGKGFTKRSLRCAEIEVLGETICSDLRVELVNAVSLDLSEIQFLKTMKTGVTVEDCSLLQSLTMPKALTEETAVIVRDCPKLEKIHGLENIRAVGRVFSISNLPRLTEIDLSGVRVVQSAETGVELVEECPALRKLTVSVPIYEAMPDYFFGRPEELNEMFPALEEFVVVDEQKNIVRRWEYDK